MLERAAVPPLLDHGRADVGRAGDGRGVAELARRPGASPRRGCGARRRPTREGRARRARAPPRASRPTCGSPSPCTPRPGACRCSRSASPRSGSRCSPSRSKRNRRAPPGSASSWRTASASWSSTIVRRTSSCCFERNRNSSRRPRTLTWRFVSVVTPYVRLCRAYRSEPTRNHRAVDERHGEGARPVALVRPELDVLGDRLAQRRQALPEVDETVVLPLLLRRAVRGVVEVLAPPGAVDAGRLQLRPGVRRDPHVLATPAGSRGPRPAPAPPRP